MSEPKEKRRSAGAERRWFTTTHWSVVLSARNRKSPQSERAPAGKAETFAGLKESLIAGRESRPYRQVAEALGMSEGAVKMAVHRLRRRYRELLREEMAQTVGDPAEIDDELRELFSPLSSQEN